jgi:hypothetical protein
MVWSAVMFVVSLVVQNVQARKVREAQRRAAEEADKQKGFQLIREGEAFAIPIVYGRQKVGGIRVYQNSFSEYKGALPLATSINALISANKLIVFTSKSPVKLDEVPAGKKRAYFQAPAGVNIKKILNTNMLINQGLPVIESVEESTDRNGGNYDFSNEMSIREGTEATNAAAQEGHGLG